MLYLENLPKQNCPELGATNPSFLVYRVCETSPPTSKDLQSQRALKPNKPFKGVSECRCNSLSVFANINDAEKLVKLPKFKKYYIGEINLQPEDGMILSTSSDSYLSHNSWWVSQSFNIAVINIIL